MTLSREQIEAIREGFDDCDDKDHVETFQYVGEIRALCDLAISAHEQRAAGVAEGLAMAAKVCNEIAYDEEGICTRPDAEECEDAIRSLAPASGTVRDGAQQT